MTKPTLLRRIFLLVSVLFFVLLATTITIIYLFFSNLLVRNAQDYLHLIMQQHQRSVNTSLQRVDEVVVGLTNDRFLYQQIALPVSENYVDHAISRQEINRYLVRSVYVPLRQYFGQVNYWFFIDDQYPSSELYASYSFPANRVLTMQRAREMEFFGPTQRARGQVYWFMQADKPNKIYATVWLRGTSSTVTIPDIGILLLEFDVSDIVGTSESEVNGASTYYLVDPNNQIFGVNGSAISVEVEQFLLTYTRSYQVVNQTVQSNNQLFSVLWLDTGWMLLGVTPFSEITRQTHRLSEFLIPLVLISLIAVVVVSYVIARSISRPIVRLSHVMQQSRHQSDFVELIPERPQTIEIAQLYDSYQQFVLRIKQLLHDVYLTGVSVKQAELRALQAQINPHFLYNTLDSISWVALDHGDSDVPRVVSSLSNILRYSINESDRLVTFADELAIVNDYLDIQNFCYQLDIQLHVDVADAHMRHQLPKLTLQPIIENAVLHGFLEQQQNSGVIHIRCQQQGNVVEYAIENPGSADIDRINALLHDAVEPQKHGVRNVHNRLRMLFGNDAGLQYMRTAHGATVANLTLIVPPESM
jgi:two-component system sensor histidine kinase YesM